MSLIFLDLFLYTGLNDNPGYEFCFYKRQKILLVCYLS